MPVVATGPPMTARCDSTASRCARPTGDQLINPFDVRLERGDSLVIVGPFGCRQDDAAAQPGGIVAISRLGRCVGPDGDKQTMFLSQLPYVPLGDFAGCRVLPEHTPAIFADDTCATTLTKVALAPLGDRLDEEEDWAKVLSPGEQQRIAFGRILLTKPRAVFLDEATSALDPGLEYALYQLGAHRIAGLRRGQCQSPADDRTAPRAAAGVARRRPVAAGPGGGAGLVS